MNENDTISFLNFTQYATFKFIYFVQDNSKMTIYEIRDKIRGRNKFKFITIIII